MLVCRYIDDGRPSYGCVERNHDSGHLVPVDYEGPDRRWVRRSGRARPVSEVVLLPPAFPSKIVCVALNYAAEGGGTADLKRRASAVDSAVVLKPPSSLAGDGDAVSHPGSPWELRHEAELAVVVGSRCKKVPPERAAEVVAGYTCANDITAYARWHPEGTAAAGKEEASGGPGTLAGPSDGSAPMAEPPVWAKHFDGFTPLGPWLATDLDPGDVEITCTVDGEARQRGSTRFLIRPVHDVIAMVSEHMTLLPGDVILTGTPAGSGPLSAGCRVEVSITHIGTLRTDITMPSGPWWPRDAASDATSAELTLAGRAAGEKGLAGDANH